MSLLSSFIQKQLLGAIESEFIAHEADIQDVIIGEVQAFANDALKWVESKLNPENQPKE